MALQQEVRALIKKYGPQLGELYFANEVAWDQVMKKLREDDENRPENPTELPNQTSNPDSGMSKSTSSAAFADFSVSPVENDEPSLDPDILSKKMM